MDIQWLAEHVKNLTMEIAALRGEAQKQIAERDKKIAELQAQGNETAQDRREATAFAQANHE